MVMVKKKNNTLRICLDSQNLNKGVVREQYQLPTFEEVASRMNNSKKIHLRR